MNRRQFLTGAAALALVPGYLGAAPKITEYYVTEFGGRTPAMDEHAREAFARRTDVIYTPGIQVEDRYDFERGHTVVMYVRTGWTL